MPVSHRQIALCLHVAPIRATLAQPVHDAFQCTRFNRCIGTFIDHGNSAHYTMLIALCFFLVGKPDLTGCSANLSGLFMMISPPLRLDHQHRVTHQGPSEQDVQQFRMGLRQFTLGILYGLADRHARCHHARGHKHREQFLR